MRTLIKPATELKSFRAKEKTHAFRKKSTSPVSLIDYKFYQKLFVLLISLSTILIFPESPIELESICKRYYSNQKCYVW